MGEYFAEVLDDFISSALVTWVKTFEKLIDCEEEFSSQYLEVNSGTKEAQNQYLRLLDGVYLNKVMRLIDPNPKTERIYRNERNDEILRIQNLSILIQHIRSFYQEDLQQLILKPLPNVAVLGREPLTERAIDEIKNLLLLLLGCAVQCERKGEFIEQIRMLDIETQTEVATYIQEITQEQQIIIPLQWTSLSDTGRAELQIIFQNMALHLKELVTERDMHLERIAELSQDKELLQSQKFHSTLLGEDTLYQQGNGFGHSEVRQNLTVQLADSKAKMRRLRQELEEKNEQLLDLRQELEVMEAEIKKLRQQNRELLNDAHLVRSYRDELDCLREKASKVEKLQNEVKGYREKLQNVDLFRGKLEEEREYSQALLETKALLEEQLEASRFRCDRLRDIEKENIFLKQRINDIEMERDKERQKVFELLEENLTLEAELKHNFVMTEDQARWETEIMIHREQGADPKPLSVEVGECSVGRLLGTERENQELRRKLERLREEMESNAEKEQLLDENRSLGEMTDRLKAELLKQAESLLRTESQKSELQCEKERLEKSLQCIQDRAAKESEDLKMENNRLNKKLDSLQKRLDECMEVKPKETDHEKKELCECVVEANTKVNQLEDKLKQAQLETEEQKTKAAHRSRELELESEKQSGLIEELRKKLLDLTKVSADRTIQHEQRMSDVEAEISRLRKASDNLKEARRQIEVLEVERAQLEEENFQLRRLTDMQKLEGAIMGQLEAANQDLERERDQMKKSVESMKTAVKKGEQLELTNQTLISDNQRLQKTLESVRKKAEQLEQEVQEAEREEQSLGRMVQEGKMSVRKLEQDKATLVAELEKAEREQRQLEKELRRLRQQAEVKDVVLDDCNLRITNLEQENRMLSMEVNQLKETSSQLRELERQNRELSQANAMDKKTLAGLQEALASEKLHCQELSNQVEQLACNLQKADFNQVRLQEAMQQNEESYKVLEQKLQFNHAESLQLKEQKLVSLKAQQTVLEDQNMQLVEELQKMRTLQEQLERTEESKSWANQEKAPKSMIQLQTSVSQYDNNGLQTSSCPQNAKQSISSSCKDELDNCDLQVSGSKNVSDNQKNTSDNTGISQISINCYEQKNSRVGTEPLSDRLIAVERNNASLLAEKHSLCAQLQQSESRIVRLQEQVDTLQKHLLSIQEQSTALQTLNTRLQVENSALSSQHASLVAQSSQAESRLAGLESENRAMSREKEEARACYEALRRDHEKLVLLHERQEVELEGLVQKYSELKGASRSQELKFKELEGRYSALMEQKSSLEEKESSLKAEQERLEMQGREHRQTLEKLAKLQEENERLEHFNKETMKVQEELHLEHKSQKSQLTSLQLEKAKLEAEINKFKEQNQQLDINITKLNNQCELLAELKGNLDEENRHLLEQNQNLSRENRELLEKTMESKDQYHQEQREYMDKLNELRREKQKLVEKIMDQYRILEPTIPVSKNRKGNWIADRMKRLIKPRRESKDLFRAQYIIAGSTENLSQLPQKEAHEQPSHAKALTGPQIGTPSNPSSPAPLRKANSTQNVNEEHKVILRSKGRKLSSRYGVSESFSPGDNKVSPRDRFRQRAAGAWDKRAASHDEVVETPSSRGSLTSSDPGDEKKNLSEDSTSGNFSQDTNNTASSNDESSSNNTEPVTRQSSTGSLHR
ncbi:protein Daple-like [Polypterus senegalus]|uniref:protein Daple-like n=1 Tax=Polypterus senegalus TaxID=55291 RepID=UPI001963E53E|nr:protein Daple-like [Polypterus senegalus]